MEKNIGLYICSGCGIGDVLDVDALFETVNEADVSPAICKSHDFLCSKEGVEFLKAEQENEGINTFVIGACSGRVNADTFDFGASITERVNLREQVAWSHPSEGEDEEDTQMIASDNLIMGMIKADATLPVEPYIKEDISKAILIVGGGLTGLTAAKEAAKAGSDVVLVEKDKQLGGWVQGLYKQAPSKPPYTELEDTNINALIADVEGDKNIKVYTGAVIEKTKGAPCMFDITINQAGNNIEERAGSIILATGATPYNAEKLTHLGWGVTPDVITNAMFEKIAKENDGKIKRPSDGKEVESIVFIHCAGSRDEEHLPYCSAACCVESLKQAKYVKEQNPAAAVYSIYKDIRSTGQAELLYKQVQQEGVFFIKGEVTSVTEDGGMLMVEATDILTMANVYLEPVDMIVLATGMVPTSAVGEIIEEKGDEDAEKEAEKEIVQETNASTGTIIKSNLLNLAYRQGPELPELRYGFPDSHFVCFPYETRRTGIYAAGAVRQPMDHRTAIEDATGAALKAIQCITMTSDGMALHPRAGDLSLPDFEMSRCTQCKRCTEECPFGAINEDEKGNPLPEPTRCRRCGTCMGACPERIISFKNYSVSMIGKMLKNISVPEDYEEKPRILVLACENDAIPAIDMAGINRLSYNPWIRIIPVRCLGSLNLIWIADALSKGIDGVMLLGCRHGEDYQCHFIKGSELATIRSSKIAETLDRLALESERVIVDEVSIMDYDKIPMMFDEFSEKLEELGPNPMKGF